MKKIYDYMRGLNTKDLVDGLFNGGLPIERNRPKEGQKDYYFYNYDTGESSDYPLNDTLKNVFGDELYSELGTAPQSAFSTQPKYSSGDLGWNNRLEASNARHPSVLYAQNMQTHSSDGMMNSNSEIPARRSGVRPNCGGVSEQFLHELAKEESSDSYNGYSPDGGGIGAWGKYQLRGPGLEDIGYVRRIRGADGRIKKEWSGKNGIYSGNDFLHSPQTQEQAICEYLNTYDNRYRRNGYNSNVGKKINGVSGETFYVTPSGMLAAAHREGQSKVREYMNSLAQDANGDYYMDYNNLSNSNDEPHFRKVERRLRRYENF